MPYADTPAARLLIANDLPERWRVRFRALLALDPAARQWPAARPAGRRRFLALGAAALLAGAAGGGAWAWLRLAEGADARRWAKGRPLALGPGARAEVGPAPGPTLPPLTLAQGAALTLALEGQARRLGATLADEDSDLTLRGPGTLTFPQGPDHAFRGRLRLTAGAAAHFESRSEGRPAVATERGSILSMETGNNRYLSAQFRALDLSRGGAFRSRGDRLYLDYQEPNAILLGQDATFEAHYVACGARVHAVSGDCRLTGIGYLWHGLRLSAAAGATLAGTGSATFAQEARLRVEPGGVLEGGEDGRGTLTLSRATLEAGAVVACRGGRVAFGGLRARGAVVLRLAGAKPGTLLTWERLDGPAPDFRAEGLPPGRALRLEPNALTLT